MVGSAEVLNIFLKIKWSTPIAVNAPSISATKSMSSGERFVGITNCRSSISNPNADPKIKIIIRLGFFCDLNALKRPYKKAQPPIIIK